MKMESGITINIVLYIGDFHFRMKENTLIEKKKRMKRKQSSKVKKKNNTLFFYLKGLN